MRNLLLSLVSVLLLVGMAGGEQGRSKRLIFKDGSYELMTRYEIRGDRVRYFSVDRNEWEELPKSLIDWPATERYAGEAAAQESERIDRAMENAAAERRQDEARLPMVAPGIRLPSPDGVYLLEQYNGVAQLAALTQNGADLNKNTGRNILRGVINPIAGPKQTVELTGLHARIQSHAGKPAIFIPVDSGDPLAGYDSQTAAKHLRIVRCRAQKGKRIVLGIDIAIYGKVKQRAVFIETKVEALSDYWVKVTPLIALEPGEYALVEVDAKGAFNQYVWDFGVNPAAPPNPDTVESTPDRSAPVLIRKPREQRKQQ